MPDMTQTEDSHALQQRAGQLAEKVDALKSELSSRVIGQEQLIEDLLVALFAGGHALLEGLPGLGKTLLVKSLAHGLGVEFGRIQFTPDLMPSDVIGTRIIDERSSGLEFRFERGPVFTNLLLADEINRTTPRTQSALLEAMQEGRVTFGDTSHELPRPFCVVATQNPIELEGTYPLPEAQLDRFLFKLVVEAPGVDHMIEILDATTAAPPAEPKVQLDARDVVEIQSIARSVLCGRHLLRFVAELLQATQPHAKADEETRRFVRYGASPRAGQAIVLAAKVRALLDGRPSVAREDLDASLLPALRHRVVLTFDAESEGRSVESLVSGWVHTAERSTK
ncbi:MAG: AAA family ATPase [Planctomycetes bacterium]|nr:AAA family ATPase [Planctomycetota bacterium]